jgi:hypothetical protein
MNNEDFQKTIIDKLDGFQRELRQFGERQDEVSTKQNEMFKSLSTRQDEMYQVLRSIEHSNNAVRQNLTVIMLEFLKLKAK